MIEKNFQKICKAEDLPVGKSKRVVLDGKAIAVFHLKDGYFALDDTCSHAGGSLAFGSLKDGVIACPRHGAQFEVCSGKVLSLPAVRGVRTYPVKIVGKDVLVLTEIDESKQPGILELR